MDPKHISLEGTADAQKKFCGAWPEIKAGLFLLQNIVKNPIVKGVINVIVNAGDAVASTICK